MQPTEKENDAREGSIARDCLQPIVCIGSGR
jgi:hypothetical protein